MRRPLLAALLLAAAIAAAARPALAQSVQPPADSTALRLDGLSVILLGELALAAERGGDSASAVRTSRAAAAAARGYRAAGRTPAIADEVLARALSTHLAGDVTSASAATLRRVDEQLFRLMLLQASQGARLVEQNDRIIALLERLVGRP